MKAQADGLLDIKGPCSFCLRLLSSVVGAEPSPCGCVGVGLNKALLIGVGFLNVSGFSQVAQQHGSFFQ